MGFDFNPRLWFVCRLCRQTFPNTDRLREHKLEDHLDDCLNIKCIVFEEKFLEQEWDPQTSNGIFSKKDYLALALCYKSYSESSADEGDHLPGSRPPHHHRLKSENNDLSVKTYTTFSSSHDLLHKSEGQENVSLEDPDPDLDPDAASDVDPESSEDSPEVLATDYLCQELVVSNAPVNTEPQGSSKRKPKATLKSKPKATPKSSSKVDVKPKLKSLSSVDQEKSRKAVSQIPVSSGRKKRARINYFEEDESEEDIPEVWESNSITNSSDNDNENESYDNDSGSNSDPDSSNETPGKRRKRGRNSNPKPKQPSLPRINDDTLSLQEWLRYQNQSQSESQQSHNRKKSTLTNHTNIIRLDPDPTAIESESFEVNSENPITCRLCLMKLVTESQVKVHALNCYLHNKLRNVFCLQCDQSFANRKELSEHNRTLHPEEIQNSSDISGDGVSTNQSAENLELTEEDLALPLDQFLKKEKKRPNQVFALEPNITETTSPSSASPIKCKLCTVLLTSDVQVKNHVRTCFLQNKSKHRYCVQCKKYFNQPRMLQRHNLLGIHKYSQKFKSKVSSQSSMHVCKNCGNFFPDKDSLLLHKESLSEFLKTLKTTKRNQDYVENIERVHKKEKVIILSEWLRFQRQIKNADGTLNVILVDPEPDQGTEQAPGNVPRPNLVVNDNNPMTCRLCLKRLVTENEVKIHVITCWTQNKEEHRFCVDCSLGFENPGDLREHRVRDHPGEFLLDEKVQTQNQGGKNKPITCQVCGTSFSQKSQLLSHMNSHSDYRPYKCPHCPAAKKSEKLLKSHLLLHGRQTQHKCRFCGKSFNSRNFLEAHERTHTGDRPFKCTVESCTSGFASKQALWIHHRAKHSDELGLEKFPCPIPDCDKSFGLQSQLSRHLQTHSEDKPFKCTVEGCTKAFKRKPRLVDHMRLHTGEKPYQCDECGQAFNRKWTFTRHCRTHEGTLNRVLCHLCPMKFPGSWELKKHLKFHEEGRQFNFDLKCGFCGLLCSTKNGLKRHEKSHDGESRLHISGNAGTGAGGGGGGTHGGRIGHVNVDNNEASDTEDQDGSDSEREEGDGHGHGIGGGRSLFADLIRM